MNIKKNISGAEVIENFTKKLPNSPGIYQMHDDKGTVLYIGKAKNLKKRVKSYTQPEKQSIRIQRMISLTSYMEFTKTHTESDALLLEANMIKKLKPRYNILLRDDKSFPYICITTSHDYPLVKKHRGMQKKGEEYFGPFASTRAVNQTLDILHKVFMLRNCTNNVFKQRTRPCMQYQIKRCTAPCINKVSKAEYSKQVDMARQFLLGKNRNIQKQLTKQMQKASDGMRYEEASILRDKIKYLTTVQSHKSHKIHGDIHAIHQANGKSCIQVSFFVHGQNFGSKAFFPRHDALATAPEVLSAFITQFYANKLSPKEIIINSSIGEKQDIETALNTKITLPQRGDKKDLVTMIEKYAKESLQSKISNEESNKKIFKQLEKVFELPETPKRIEVYDNSHISGKHAIGAMVVVTPEGFKKSAYRKFNMSDKHNGDDFAMMYEMIYRRLKKIDEDTKPDLLLIDGGKGQLTVVLKAMKDAGVKVPVVAIAKGPDRNAGHEQFFIPNKKPMSLDYNSSILHFLQRIRDEVHRFVINSHRGKRSKAIISNPLDNIPGIGAKRKKTLLLHFGSAKSVAEVGISDLQKVEGISRIVAERIYYFFHEGKN